MTKEEIINIAWNIFPISDREKNEAFIELLVHFAQAIAKKEREEIEKRVMELDETMAIRANVINNAIRARGQE
jgi:hypothetical protein